MDKNNLANSLKHISLFADLPDDMISQLAENVKEQRLAPGEILFNEGDEGTALYFVQAGEVEIYQPASGKVFELLKAGDYFGEMALIEVEPRSASARACDEVTLFFLDRTAFMGLLEKNPQLGIKMTHRISSRLRTSMSAQVEPEKKAEEAKNETKVFISYSRRDKAFVVKLNEALSKYQINTWVDWENIPLTADWWNEIRLGIENADAFAFVISPDSLTSEVCGREIQTAVDNHKRLIPILHRDPQKGNPMHEKISSHNWIYMRDDAELVANVPQMLAVVNTDLDFVKTHTRLLERALGWEREKKNDSFLLQGDELHNAERWLESAGNKQPQPTALHIEFIQASRRAANQRQRRLLTASLVGLGIAVVLAIVSFVFFLQARQAKADAEVQRDNAIAAEVFANEQANIAATAQFDAEGARDHALVAQATAEAAKVEAENQADIAATKQAEAEAAKAEAEAQKALAEEQARLAKAGDLAASGLTLVESNPPLAILLALESNNLSPDNKTAQEVFSLIPIYFPPLKEAFIDPSQSVENIAWSPSGKLASSSGSSIIIWNLGTYEPEQTFLDDGYITALAWAPDGRLATGDDLGQITLWDIETGEAEPVEVVNDEGVGITSLVWNPRGYLTYATGDSKNTIVVQDLTGTFPPTKIPNRAHVNALAWNASATPVLAAGLDDGSVALWIVSVSEAKPTNVINYYDHQSGVISVAYAPDGSLATGSKDSTVAVRGEFGSLKAILHGHTDYVNAVAWSDDNQLASGSWDKTVILWDLENEVAQRVFRGHSSAVSALDWGPEGKLTSGADFIYVWDTAANNSLTTYPGHLDWTYSVQWTPQGQLVSVGGDNRVIFWDEETQAIQQSMPNASYGNLVTFSNNRVLSGGYLIDREEKKNYWLPGYGHIFSPDGNSVVGLTGTEMAMWPIEPLFESGELITETLTVEETSNMQSVTWSPDRKTIATGQYDGTIILWDYNPGGPSVSIRATLPGHPAGLSTMAWSPDGRLASIGSDNTIIVWDIAAQAEEKMITTNSEFSISGMSWGPNGQLATVSGDNNIVIWDVDKGEKVAVLGAPYRAGITSVAWSPDGTQLAFGGQSYNVYVYNTRFIQDPCTWLTRNMTYNEWTTYLPGEPYRATCPDRPVGTAFEDEKQAQTTALLNEAIEGLMAGEIELGLQKFQEVEAQGLEIDAWSWNNLCWYGALYNQAEISSFACDRAVELAPDDGDIRDSRGVSRALLGDFEGAIEDFEAFIAYAQEWNYPEIEIALRQQWIEALQAGTNPFDEETLAMLREE